MRRAAALLATLRPVATEPGKIPRSVPPPRGPAPPLRPRRGTGRGLLGAPPHARRWAGHPNRAAPPWPGPPPRRYVSSWSGGVFHQALHLFLDDGPGIVDRAELIVELG